MPPIPAQTEGVRWSAATWGVCMVLLLASALNYMDRQTLGNLQPRIEKEFGLNNEQYGNLELGFGLAFAAGAIVFGVTADLVNVRWLYPLMILLWSGAGALTAYSRDYNELLACRILLGFFEAAHWPCALRTTQRLLSPADRTFGNSLLQSGTSIGAVITPVVIGVMVVQFQSTWRMPFLVIGIAGMAWVGAWFAVSHHVNLSPGNPATAGQEAIGERDDDAFVRLFLVRIGAMLAILVAGHLLRVWWPTILDWLGNVNARGDKASQQISITAGHHVAISMGSILAGVATVWLQGRGSTIRRTGWIAVAGGAACAATSLYLPWMPPEPLLLVVLLVIAAGRMSNDRSEDDTFVRRFFVMIGVVISINIAWHLFRAWLPKFLEQGRGYTEAQRLTFTAVFNGATDVGCLLAGIATVWLQNRGESVSRTRRIVFTGCAACCAISLLIPWLPKGPLLLGVLLAIAGGLLGLFPCYYTWSQDLSRSHQGKVTGLLGTIAWLVTAPMHKYYGRLIDWTKDYNAQLVAAGQEVWIGPFDAGLALVGCLPLVGAAITWLWWEGRLDRSPVNPEGLPAD